MAKTKHDWLLVFQGAEWSHWKCIKCGHKAASYGSYHPQIRAACKEVPSEPNPDPEVPVLPQGEAVPARAVPVRS